MDRRGWQTSLGLGQVKGRVHCGESAAHRSSVTFLIRN